MAKQKSTISRRAALSAGLAATTAIATTAAAPALAAAEPDRIFAMIEEHRRLYKAFGDAISARDDAFDCRDYPEDPLWCSLVAAVDAAGQASIDAEQALVEVGPTSPEGWGALLRYEDEFRRARGEFVDLSTGDTWRMGLLRRLAAFLDGKPEWEPISQKLWPLYASEGE